MIRCAVIGCQRTMRGEGREALCPDHWRMIPKEWRRIYDLRVSRGLHTQAQAMWGAMIRKAMMVAAGNDGEFAQ